ncbi:hypothetical protein FRC12_021843 [Ceratobasidium sp. 428]|nr:hypothetical protein FRC12_021843 [Ceratobasidium sp. 428]
MTAVIVKKSHPERPLKHIPNECKHGDTLWSMLRKCWTYSPGDRPSAAEVQDIMRGVTDKGLNLLAKHTQNGTMLSSPSAPGSKGGSGAGPSGSKDAKPAENTRPARGRVDGTASRTGVASNTGAKVAGAGVVHGSPRAGFLALGSEADAVRGQMLSPPPHHPIRDPPIDVRLPTTDVVGWLCLPM